MKEFYKSLKPCIFCGGKITWDEVNKEVIYCCNEILIYMKIKDSENERRNRKYIY